MIAITAAANTKGDWRLDDCVLYVTKEPCPMCAGAIVNSRLKMVVFGCYDEQEGCCGSLYQLCGDPRLSTTVAVKGGILEKKCLSLIREFFQVQRTIKRPG
jgi:tRNA(adenine34) deaminase